MKETLVGTFVDLLIERNKSMPRRANASHETSLVHLAADDMSTSIDAQLMVGWPGANEAGVGGEDPFIGALALLDEYIRSTYSAEEIRSIM